MIKTLNAVMIIRHIFPLGLPKKFRRLFMVTVVGYPIEMINYTLINKGMNERTVKLPFRTVKIASTPFRRTAHQESLRTSLHRQ